MFALLEHADESGVVQGSDGSNRIQQQQLPKTDRVAKQQHLAYARQQQHGSNRPPSATQQTARAEEYYRAFVHVYRDPGLDEVVLRFHKTKAVRVRASGDLVLTSGGWHTATTVAALNDALHALGMRLTYQPPVSAGAWSLTDDSGAQQTFKDGMVIKATKPEHGYRASRLLKAYNGGIDVPRYAPRPATHTHDVNTARAPQPVQQPATNTGAPARPWKPTATNHAAEQRTGPNQPAGSVLEQLKASMAELGMDDDELIADDHLCVVCLERARDEVLVPCGHMALCHACCADIMASTNECPMCRESIEDHCTITNDDA